jgi:broad specificity phosphatase PhoE
MPSPEGKRDGRRRAFASTAGRGQVDMARLILVRHAEVAQDPKTPVERWSLSPEGARAAAALRAHPSLVGPAAVWSSPEPKALATAGAIWPEVEIRPHQGLRELNRRAVGWVGSHAEYRRLVTEILGRPDESVRGCEAARDAGRRMASAVEEILAESRGLDVAVVSHGLVLTLYVSSLLRSISLGASPVGIEGSSLDIWRGIRFPDVAVVDADARIVVVPFGSVVA